VIVRRSSSALVNHPSNTCEGWTYNWTVWAMRYRD